MSFTGGSVSGEVAVGLAGFAAVVVGGMWGFTRSIGGGMGGLRAVPLMCGICPFAACTTVIRAWYVTQFEPSVANFGTLYLDELMDASDDIVW